VSGAASFRSSIGATFVGKTLRKQVAPTELTTLLVREIYRQVVPTGLASLLSSLKSMWLTTSASNEARYGDDEEGNVRR
jgi:hypothetical protein